MRFVFPLVIGVGGVLVLLALGTWQVQRLAWKEAMLSDISARIVGTPVALPDAPDPENDRYLPVRAEGAFTGPELHQLGQVKGRGPGYRVVQAFETDGRRVMVDRGFISSGEKDAARKAGAAEIVGNLAWPNERDGFTPENDLGRNIWFARDVPAMAEALDTEPVLIVLRETDEVNPAILPQPVTTLGIPNNHFQYAVTWFGLALVWAGMTLWWIIRRRAA